MRIFLLGDFESDNGPGNANKKIRDSLLLKYEIKYSKEKGRVRRIYEMYKGIAHSDILLICSASQINYLAVRVAKKQGKKILYLMHGYSSYEKKLENPELTDNELKKTYDYEEFIFTNSDRIICVSKRFMDYMKTQISKYADKFEYIFNTIDVEGIEKIYKNNPDEERKNQILSVGGGKRQKNILTLAKVLAENDKKTKFIVVGKSLQDGERIKAFDNVMWYEHLKHEELYRVMAETTLYIQNSIFETFGLAVVEALYAGCSVLVSNAVGCLDLFENLTDQDVIYDTYDKKEIQEKVDYLLLNPNNQRLMKGLKKECLSKEWQANRWHDIINSMNNI